MFGAKAQGKNFHWDRYGTGLVAGTDVSSTVVMAPVESTVNWYNLSYSLFAILGPDMPPNRRTSLVRVFECPTVCRVRFKGDLAHGLDPGLVQDRGDVTGAHLTHLGQFRILGAAGLFFAMSHEVDGRGSRQRDARRQHGQRQGQSGDEPGNRYRVLDYLLRLDREQAWH